MGTLKKMLGRMMGPPPADSIAPDAGLLARMRAVVAAELRARAQTDPRRQRELAAEVHRAQESVADYGAAREIEREKRAEAARIERHVRKHGTLFPGDIIDDGDDDRGQRRRW